MIRALRNKVPEILEKKGKFINYLTANTDIYFTEVLCNSLVTETKNFLQHKDLETLADINSLLFALAELGGISKEAFSSFIQTRTEELGDYSNRFFYNEIEIPETVANSEANMEETQNV